MGVITHGLGKASILGHDIVNAYMALDERLS